MPSRNVIRLSHRRPKGERTLDLWELAVSGTTGSGGLGLGAPLDKVAEFIGLHPVDEAIRETGVAGYAYWEIGAFAVSLDAERRWEGIYFGGRHDGEIGLDVESAVSGHTVMGEPVPTPPGVELRLSETTRVRLRDQRLSAFATLPRFLGVMSDVTTWHHASRPYDKWIRLAHDAGAARLTAEFVLKAFPTRYVDSFNVDYCLLGIGVMRHAPRETEAFVLSPAT